MLNKTLACLTVGLALGAATVQLPAATCITTTAPSEKACESRCCANMACCERSAEPAAPPAQPLAKSGLQRTVSAIPAIAAVTLAMPAVTELPVFYNAEDRAHSPPPLALTCIRLI